MLGGSPSLPVILRVSSFSLNGCLHLGHIAHIYNSIVPMLTAFLERSKVQYNVIPLKKDLASIMEQLKEQGNQGWELVTVIHQPEAYKLAGLSSYLAYFKKPEKIVR